jgi:hypothetical protein
LKGFGGARAISEATVRFAVGQDRPGPLTAGNTYALPPLASSVTASSYPATS